jgi:signal transduction histidine kinase
VAAGASVRTRRLHLAAFLDAANALARDQEQRALLAQAAERARIAREMHDIVAHSLSVMVALGGGAAASVDWAPDRAKAALDDLVSTGRSALGDMRRVLGVLHEGDPAQGGARLHGGDTTGSDPTGGDGIDSVAPLEPQPGGVDLAVLVDRFRGTGLRVSTVGADEGDVGDLDASLQLAVYRIVQEALTNALRHAPETAGVEVEVHPCEEHVEVIVTDRGTTVPVSVGQGSDQDSGKGSSPGSGRGLVGMRERAAVFGGTVEAGPYGGGWRVRALLPRRETDG